MPRMIQGTTRLALGYTAMLVHALTHWRGYHAAGVRTALARQVQLTGVQALPVVALVAVLFGAVVSTQGLALLGPDNPLVLKNLVWGGVLELGPLIAAGVVIVRSSVAMAAELALMRLRGEFKEAVHETLALEEEVVLPRVLGTALSTALLVAYFQAVAIGAALLATAALLGTPLGEEADAFLEAGEWWQVPLGLAKGALFGLGIGAVACFHGLSAQWSLAAVPKAAVAAGVSSVLVVLAAQALFVGLRFL